jgi:flagellar biosynthesis protein FliP
MAEKRAEEVEAMIITAMYIYGIISASFEFSWLIGLLCFVMDVIMALCIGGDR